MTSRSVWHSPAALIRTKTSLRLSSSAMTVSTVSGVCAACNTAARYSMLMAASGSRRGGGSPRGGRRAGVVLDHLGALLADHDGRGVGVTGRHRRHHRSVDDPQALDADNPEARID